MAIKSIIFDFGGIFIDINYAKTRDAFIEAGVTDFDAYYQQSHSNPLFSDLEKGLLTPEGFCNTFRKDTGLSLTDTQILHAWNALLGNYRKEALAILPALKEKYNLYLLSNTNLIHYNAFTDIYEQEIGNRNFDQFFHKAYYSHNINLRKPDAESYLFIVNENHLKPEETLFVDDTYKNIEGATAVGLQTLWLQNGMLLEQELPAYLASAV